LNCEPLTLDLKSETNQMININQFICEHITKRTESLFQPDLRHNYDQLLTEITGKKVLIIGGAGTIGSSFIKVLLRFQPSSLIVVDISENGLTELTRDLRSTYGLQIPGQYKTYPVNFGDIVFTRILKEHGPFDIVANFAAHKHVRSEKDHHSVTALLENNVIKAEKLLQLLVDHSPRHFFCVSTDKAANPVNIMGASKKIMEEVIMAYSSLFPITTARFANVAFSNGSLLDGFLLRLMKRQPFSAPMDVKRYFLSPEESGQICLLACILGKSGEIFFPRLDERQMMTFSDIGDQLLISIGLEPLYCKSEEEARYAASFLTRHSKLYPVYYFQSDTSGEKSFEEFFTEGEEIDLSSYSSLGVIKNAPKRSIAKIKELTSTLESLLNQPVLTKQEIVQLLSKIIPNFEHIETGKNLDQKM
jgi:FlaA1/EpsC-like NDP-sugar epimerase